MDGSDPTPEVTPTPTSDAGASTPVSTPAPRASAALKDLPIPDAPSVSEPSSQPVSSGSAVTPASQPATTPEQQVAQATGDDSFLAGVRALGFQDVADRQQAEARVLEAYRLERQRAEYAQQQYQQAAVYAQQYAALQQDPRWQALQQQQAPQPEQPKSWWQAPEFDPSLLEQYREPVLDAEGKPTGQQRWKADAPVEYQQQTAAYQQYIQKWERDLLTKPHEVLPKIIQDVVAPLFEQEFERRQQQMQAQQFVQNVVQKNADWMYARDPVTQRPLTDPMGNPVLSQDGQRINEYVQLAAQYGIQDPQLRWQFATSQLELELRRQTAQQQQVQQTSTQVNDQLKLQHLQAAAVNTPSRTAAVGTPAQPARRGNKALGAGEKLAAAFAAQGIPVPSPV